MKDLETMEDVQTVYEIYKSNPDYFEWVKNPNPTLEDVIRDNNQRPAATIPQQKHFQLIEENQGVIDFITDYPEKKSVYIGLFMVHKKQHGKGTLWIQTFEENLKEQDYKRIILGVLEINHRALAFWKKLGFQKTACSKAIINNQPFTIVQMYKEL